MRFWLGDDLLAQVPEYMVGVVVARFARPPGDSAAGWAAELLAAAVAALPSRLVPSESPEPGAAVRSDPRVAAWRDAFSRLGINPRRYPSSIEALATRVTKGSGLPSLNPLVDLANTVALRHLVPVGAHDLAVQTGDLGVRLSRGGEPFGVGGADERVPVGEPVYADATTVRTRRWVWRQAEAGRITTTTTEVFLPIDGFRGRTESFVLAAAQDLLDLLSSLSPLSLALYRLDADCRSVDLGVLPSAGRPDIRTLPVASDLRAEFTRLAASPPAERRELYMVDQPRSGGPAAPPVTTDDAAIQEILERTVEIVEVRADLEKALRAGQQLRVKLGIDPTGPRIHIGRAVTLRKMRQFQRLGHHAVLIVGDLTAQVGDASDKDTERPMLDAAQVRENMRSYEQQIGMIVDVAQAEFQYNSTWLNALTFKDVINLAKHFTAAQMIQRENFRNRWEAGERIGLHELLYPLMQGYDSLAIKADVELGGTDQLFNVLAGRKVQEIYGQKPQNVLLMGMIMGPDGRKMSTSWGNTIFVNDAPVDQYGKVMSTNDSLIIPYLESCTDVPLPEIRRLAADLAAGQAHPKEVKKFLAWHVVSQYHGIDAANFAQAEFAQVVEQRGAPSDVPGVTVPAGETRLADLLLATGQAPSKNHARRLIEQGGVEIDGARIADVNATLLPRDGMLIRCGKRSFVRLQVR